MLPLELFRKYGLLKGGVFLNFLVLILIGLGTIGIELILPLFSKILFDYAYQKKEIGILKAVSLCYAGFYCLHFLSQTTAGFLEYITAQKLAFRLRSRLYQTIFKLSHQTYKNFSKGDMIIRLTDDIERIVDGVFKQRLDLFLQINQILGILTICFWINFQASFWIASSLPVYLVLSRYIFKKELGVVRDKIIDQKSKLLEYLQNKLNQMSLIKAFDQEKKEVQIHRDLMKSQVSLGLQDKFLKSIFSINSNLGFDLWTVFITWALGYKVILGDLTIGEVVSLLLLFSQIKAPSLAMTLQFGRYRASVASLKRLDQVLSHSELESLDIDKSKEVLEGKLEFKKVDFSYSGNRLIKDLSFTVFPKTLVAIAGKNGSGRSTICQLILKNQTPTQGEIEIDGNGLSEFSHQEIRKSIAYLQQDHGIFPGTIAENIGYGIPEATLEEIAAAAKGAALWHWIQSLPKGLDTLLKGDTDVSRSEKVRIALARALLVNPKILILDEVTSGFDAMSDYLFQEVIRNQSLLRTIILITNQTSHLRNCDRIFFLFNGGQIEEGRFEELFEKKGEFFKYYLIQNSGFETFKQVLDYEVERCQRYSSKFSIISYTITNFKMIENRIPRQHLPQFNADIGLAWIEATRRGDRVALLQEGKFLVLLPEMQEIHLKNTLDRIGNSIRNRVFKYEGDSFHLDLSEKYMCFSKPEDLPKSSEEILFRIVEDWGSMKKEKVA